MDQVKAQLKARLKGMDERRHEMSAAAAEYHVKAMDEGFTERYLLREMPPAEAKRFERHLFECQECAAAVEDGDILFANGLFANGREVAAEPETAPTSLSTSPKERRGFWEALKTWAAPPWMVQVPVAASLAFGALALYQGAVVIPSLRQVASVGRLAPPAFQLIGVSRGDIQEIAVAPGTPAFTLILDIPPGSRFPQYICELSSGERPVLQLKAQAPASGQPIAPVLPTKDLRAGDYQLTLFAADAEGNKREPKVSSYSFRFSDKLVR